MVKYLAIIQARLSSSRLPAKVLLDLGGQTLLQRVYDSAVACDHLDKIVVATSDTDADDVVYDYCLLHGINCFRSHLTNVAQRFIDVVTAHPSENIVRITADNPLTCPLLMSDLIEAFEKEKSDYAITKNAPYGASVEVFKTHILLESVDALTAPTDQEHVTPYLRRHYKVLEHDALEMLQAPDVSVTIDTLEDYCELARFYSYCRHENLPMTLHHYLQLEKQRHASVV